MTFNKALVALPWRVLIPVLLVIGLGMTFWGGAYLIGSATYSWRKDLQILSVNEYAKTSAQWYRLSGISLSLAELVQIQDAENRITAQEWQVATADAQQQAPTIRDAIYIEFGGSPDRNVLVASGRITSDVAGALQRRIQREFENENVPQLTQMQVFAAPLQRALHQILNESDSRVIYAGMSIEAVQRKGMVVIALSPQEILPNLQGRRDLDFTGLTLVVRDQTGAPIWHRELLTLPAMHQFPKLPWQYNVSTDWGGASWDFIWEFNRRSLGGPVWWPGFLMIGLGFLVTAIVGWVFWTQQSLSRQIQSQVVLRTNQLEQASRRFRLITDNSYDLITILTTQGKVEYINSAYHRVLGYSREELKQQELKQYIHPKDQPAYEKFWRDVANGKGGSELTYRIRSKQGQWYFLEAVAKGLHNSDWVLCNIVIHSRDITSRKMYAEELARSEQRFRDFADSSADWLWEMNEDRIFTYISPGINNVLGFEPEEVVGQMRFDDLFIDPDDATKELIESRIQRHQPYRDLEFWTKSKQNEKICLRISGVPVFNDRQLFSGYRGAASNITANKLEHEANYRLANRDDLTGLLNRRRFTEELERTVSLAQRHGTSGVILQMDLDRFKEVNDTHGHAAGDTILIAVGRILGTAMRTTDIVARLGGDEFAIIMHDIDADQAAEKMRKVIEEVNNLEVEYENHTLKVTMSVGMVDYPQEGKSGSDLLMAADLAMYRAKDLGRNRLYIDQGGGDGAPSVGDQLKWLDLLRRALAEDSFEMHFQPLMPSSKKLPVHYEALLRIRDDDGKIGAPFLFIEAAEHFGLIQDLDLAVINRCFSIQKDFKDKHKLDLSLSINLSTRSIGDPEIIQRLREAADHHEINPNKFIIEITETAALHDPRALRELDKIKTFIDELRDMGFRIAIDDFGSGFSSFWYLRTLNVDMVKIDGKFVKELDKSEDDFHFVKAMSDVAHSRDISTVAEFVENGAIVDQLLKLGIDYGQGYHISKPEPDLLGLVKALGKHRLGDYGLSKQPAAKQPTKKAPAAKKTVAKKAPPKRSKVAAKPAAKKTTAKKAKP